MLIIHFDVWVDVKPQGPIGMRPQAVLWHCQNRIQTLWMSDECCESMLCDRLPSKLDKVLSHLWTLQRRKANRKPIQYLTLQQGRNGFVNESVTSLGKSFAPFIDGSFASHNRPIALKRRPHQTPPMTPCNSPVKPKVKASGDSGFSPNITKNH